MTTITNFLHGNFISTQTKQTDKERPVWVVVAKPQQKSNNLRDYTVEQSKSKNIPLIHIDLGISQIKKYNETNCEEIELQCGIKLLKPIKDKAYYILKWRSGDRMKKQCLSELTKKLSLIEKSQIMRKEEQVNKIAGFLKNSYGLLVEGLQLMASLSNSYPQIQSFVNDLSNLPSCFKQLIVFTLGNQLNQEILFALERISTCLTTITSFNSIQNNWKCLSTVRRYTGYSNEEEYLIKRVGKNLKVEKYIQKIEKGQTKEQKEMVDSLKFVVKKDQQEKKRQEELKKIIYPHLRVQDMCHCGKQGCGTCSKGDQELDLIVLDEEQEDDDDLDV